MQGRGKARARAGGRAAAAPAAAAPAAAPAAPAAAVRPEVQELARSIAALTHLLTLEVSRRSIDHEARSQVVERLLGRAAHASAAPGAAAPGDADAVRGALRLLVAAAVGGLANAPSKEEEIELSAVACSVIGACGALLRLAPAARPAAAEHAAAAAALDLALQVLRLLRSASDLGLPTGRHPLLERLRLALGAVKATLCGASLALRVLLAAPPAAAPALADPSGYVLVMAEGVMALYKVITGRGGVGTSDWYARWAPDWSAAAGAVLSYAGVAARHPLWAGAWAKAITARGAQDVLCQLAWQHAVDTTVLLREAEAARLEPGVLLAALEGVLAMARASGEGSWFEVADAHLQLGEELLPLLARAGGACFVDDGCPPAALFLPLGALVAQLWSTPGVTRAASQRRRDGSGSGPLERDPREPGAALCLALDCWTLRFERAGELRGFDEGAAVARATAELKALSKAYCERLGAPGLVPTPGEWERSLDAAAAASLALAALLSRASVGPVSLAESQDMLLLPTIFVDLHVALMDLPPSAAGSPRDTLVRAVARLAEAQARVLLALPASRAGRPADGALAVAAAQVADATFGGLACLAETVALFQRQATTWLRALSELPVTAAERADGCLSVDRASDRANAAAPVVAAAARVAADALVRAGDFFPAGLEALLGVVEHVAATNLDFSLFQHVAAAAAHRMEAQARLAAAPDAAREHAPLGADLFAAVERLMGVLLLRERGPAGDGHVLLHFYAAAVPAVVRMLAVPPAAGDAALAARHAAAASQAALVLRRMLKAAAELGAPVGRALDRADALLSTRRRQRPAALIAALAPLADALEFAQAFWLLWRETERGQAACAHRAELSLQRWCSSARCAAPLLSSQRGLADGRGFKWRRRCRACLVSKYCSEACAADDWDEHTVACEELAQARG